VKSTEPAPEQESAYFRHGCGELIRKPSIGDRVWIHTPKGLMLKEVVARDARSFKAVEIKHVGTRLADTTYSIRVFTSYDCRAPEAWPWYWSLDRLPAIGDSIYVRVVGARSSYWRLAEVVSVTFDADLFHHFNVCYEGISPVGVLRTLDGEGRTWAWWPTEAARVPRVPVAPREPTSETKATRVKGDLVKYQNGTICITLLPEE
jgi:hypothetical protein